MEDRRFAFILGAGASINSNIKGASTLAHEWMEIIYHRQHELKNSDYQSWLESNPLDFKGWESNNLAKHYPQIFEKCFEGDHDSGYAALEKAIKDGKPSLGYAVLAWILSTTRHRMVITTNFDNLVADAVSIYGGTYPHVIGHESLACYAKPLSRRPIVAKIHRDLFTDPINTCEGTSALEKSWIETLKNIFKFYTPVFIGYGGNDGSLMDFLQDLDTKDISGRPFWCYYSPGGEPNNSIKQLMAKHSGALVPITGFDEFMLQMGEAIGFKRDKQIEEIKKNSEQLINQIQEQMLSLSKETQDVIVKGILQPQNKERDNWNWLDWQLKINETSDIDEQEKLYNKAIKTLPNSHQLLGNYAIFLEKNKEFKEAEKFYLHAIEAEPKHANNLGNYALFLNKLDRFKEAEQYYHRAMEVDPTHANTLGNYAVFLKENGKFDEAENFHIRAMEADPTHANNLENYALWLTDKGQLSKAEHFYLRAIEVEPNDADFLGSYALFLNSLDRFEEVDEYYHRAIEVDPTHANNLGNYAIFLSNFDRFEEAEQYYHRAIEVDPTHTNNLGNYADFLKDRERLKEARKVIQQALAIEPNSERLLDIQQQIQQAHLEEMPA
ncbi:tetratricopeptide repeat protein [Photobacterium leiognathi]|uniref:tetratricopeptide repeat protein n=1 Tax=Photobacterium leiognathi TaxID=553611 RepID=UPI0027386AAC|nr:tetratricopeptide repeat protein [Photobacterium leiognathi]